MVNKIKNINFYKICSSFIFPCVIINEGRGEEMDDERIHIQKATMGDKESFEYIINAYKNYVFAIILSFIKDRQEAENIAQEVFLQIYISLPKFQEKNFKAWVSRITTNKSIDFLRKKRSRIKENEVEGIDIINFPYPIENTNEPEYLFIKKEDRQELIRQIEALPETYKNTIKKFYLEEKSYEKIASEENISIKTVESRLYRGRILLKKNWRDRDESL